MNKSVEIDIETLTNQYFQLQSLTVFNWGPFSGTHKIELSPLLSLIAGQSGSGKSSLIDAYITMLNGNDSVFNMAAAKGKKHDRTLATYVRGAKAQDMSGTNIYERNGATLSGIQATLKCVDGRSLSLVGLFYFVSDATTTSDMRKYYLLDQEPNSELTDYLEIFNQAGSNEDSLKRLKAYANQPHKRIEFHDTFRSYQTSLLQHLQLDDPRGLKLIGMAMGTKSIDNITELMRRFALSDDSIEAQAEDFVSSFDDVNKIRNSILETEEQIKILTPLQRHCEVRQQTMDKLNQVNIIKENFEVYQLEHRVSDNDKNIKEASEQRRVERSIQSDLESELTDKSVTLEQYQKELLLKGGNQLDALEKDNAELKRTLPEKERKLKLFENVCEQFGHPCPENDAQFESAKHQFRDAEAKTDEQMRLLDKKQSAIIIEHNDVNKALKERQNELTLLKNTTSAMDVRYLRLRELIIEQLNINEEDLKFVAEMIKVKDEEHEWQGAIERAIGEARFTLLCNDDDYRPIIEWMNNNHLGLKLRLENTGVRVNAKEFYSDSHLKKLQWQAHPFREYVKAILSHKQFHCVNSINELKRTEYALTKQGSMQFAHGTFFKNDTYQVNDRSRWYTGFDNERRKALLEEEIAALSSKVSVLIKDRTAIDNERGVISNRASYLSSVKYFTWDDMNVADVKSRIEENQRAIAALKDASSELSKLSLLIGETKKALGELNNKNDQQKILIDRLDRQIFHFEKDTESLLKELGGRSIDEQASKNVEAFLLSHQLSIDNEMARRNVMTHLQESISGFTSQIAESVKSIEKILTRFADNYPTHQYPQLHGTDVLSSAEYLTMLDKLVDENLPSLKEEFNDYLNNEIMHDAASLEESANAIIEEIDERIYDINQILSRCDFGESSYLEIEHAFKRSDVVDDFKRLCKSVKKLELDMDAEKQFKAIERLIEFIKENMDKAAVMARNELFIPKHRLTFVVHETDRETGKPVDTLTSTGSKSGGEKESFSASIIAACLAYTLRPDGWDKPALTTLFLDEAFSNTSISLALRAMNLFSQLGLQANLITPLKNFELAEEKVQKIFLTSKDDDAFSSTLTVIEWDALKEQAEAYA